MATAPARPSGNSNRRPARTFRDLHVWRKAFELAVDVHRLTAAFPSEAPADLSQGMRESATASATQIAQGHTHSYIKDFLRCLDDSLAAVADLETRVLLASALGYLKQPLMDDLAERVGEIRKMEWALVNGLRARQERSHVSTPASSNGSGPAASAE